MTYRASVMLVLSSVVSAHAGEEDATALALADKAAVVEEHLFGWNAMLEAAAVDSPRNADNLGQHGERLSGDLRYDDALAAGLRGVLSDRLDVVSNSGSGVSEINTLREAYLNWQPEVDGLFGIGRINVRNGVAFGYNPTDYFKEDAIRAIDSPDPSSLKINRLGTVVLRAQTLWNGGSLTVLDSPRLATEPSSGAFNVDLGATNRQNRWLISVSQKLSRGFDPQLLVFGDGHTPPQVGMNFTYLLNSATVAYFEWSAGRGATLLARSLGTVDPNVFASRISTGITYTTPLRISVTVEFEQNHAAVSSAEWNSLRYGHATRFRQYLSFAAEVQDLPTRQEAFTYVQMTDIGLRHLDAAAFMRFDLADHSKQQWVEARYHQSKWDVALQLQFNRGSSQTVYGASPQRQVEQLLVDFYFP